MISCRRAELDPNTSLCQHAVISYTKQTCKKWPSSNTQIYFTPSIYVTGIFNKLFASEVLFWFLNKSILYNTYIH